MVEGAPHIAKRSQGSIGVSMGCPLPPYIKEQGRRRPALGGGAPKGGNPTPSRIPPSSLVQVGEGKEGKEKEKEGEGGKGGKGVWPPSPIRFGLGGRAPCLLSSTTWPMRPIASSSYSRNSPVPPKIPESLGTLPMSEYSRPIYRSLRLDHFETPRHVPDLIRDSELLRYIKTHKLII